MPCVNDGERNCYIGGFPPQCRVDVLHIFRLGGA
jgi:hypothetical protein